MSSQQDLSLKQSFIVLKISNYGSSCFFWAPTSCLCPCAWQNSTAYFRLRFWNILQGTQTKKVHCYGYQSASFRILSLSEECCARAQFVRVCVGVVRSRGPLKGLCDIFFFLENSHPCFFSHNEFCKFLVYVCSLWPQR